MVPANPGPPEKWPLKQKQRVYILHMLTPTLMVGGAQDSCLALTQLQYKNCLLFLQIFHKFIHFT